MIRNTKLALAIGTAGSSGNDALDAAMEDRTLVGHGLPRLVLYPEQDVMSHDGGRQTTTWTSTLRTRIPLVGWTSDAQTLQTSTESRSWWTWKGGYGGWTPSGRNGTRIPAQSSGKVGFWGFLGRVPA